MSETGTQIQINTFSGEATGHVDYTFNFADGHQETFGTNVGGFGGSGTHREDHYLSRPDRQSITVEVSADGFASALMHTRDAVAQTEIGRGGYGLAGQNCVDQVRSALTIAFGFTPNVEPYVLGGLVDTYAAVTDFLVAHGGLGYLNDLGNTLSALGHIGDHITGGFADAARDLARGDMLGAGRDVFVGVGHAVGHAVSGIISSIGNVFHSVFGDGPSGKPWGDQLYTHAESVPGDDGGFLSGPGEGLFDTWAGAMEPKLIIGDFGLTGTHSGWAFT